ncbi:MAG: hypothetical protein L7U86_05480 [Rhodobacteraceae bacterium]|nr:hypothetical protein [Paracoccaceae bacterium]
MSISSQSFLEYMNSSNIVPIAHRGASLVATENSFESFRKAFDLGYRIIETDIHSSKDGTAYIFHDNTLERLTGENLKISDLKDVDIDSLKVNKSSIIPRLSNVFEEFPEGLFNLDAKTWEATIPITNTVKKMACSSRVCIGSYNDKRIDAIIRELGVETCHSMGTSNVFKFYLGAQLGIKQNFTAQCIQLPIKQFGISLITQKILRHARKLGIKIHFWTINNSGLIQKLLELDVDGIMTDDCILLKTIMEKKHKWPA